MIIFSSDETEKLVSILKWIIPSGDTGMPELELILHNLDLADPNHIQFVERSKIICRKVEKNQIESENDINRLKKAHFRDFSVFVNSVLILYYSQKEVLLKLEVGGVPPFPEGNFVKEGDIYLLEDVFLRGKIYKD